MKLTTAIPSLLARLSELVERDVESNLEVHQQALFSLPPIPDRFNLHVNVPQGVQRQSFLVRFFAHITNPVAGGVTDIVGLGRGLWKLNLFVSFGSNFTCDNVIELTQIQISQSSTGIVVPLVILGNATSGGGQRDTDVERILSIEDDGYVLQTNIPSPPAAGNLVSLAVAFDGSKLL